MKIYDMHVHSRFSPDGKATAAEQCAEAVAKGLAGIAFTEHYDVCDLPFGHRFYLQIERERIAETERLQKEYEGRLEVLLGLELGQPEAERDGTAAFLQTRRFDFILGSIHLLHDGRDVYDMDYPDPSVIDDMFSTYFDDMLSMVRFGGIDCLAHLDYPLRVMKGRMQKPTIAAYREQVDEVLKTAVQKGIGLEINTRGLSLWMEDVGPERFVLRRYRELGGEILTVGSDSHVTRSLGAGAREAAAAAAECGFKALCWFKGRTPYFVDING